MELLGHANPTLRILEIGAGTGSITESILKHLKSAFGERMYSKYVYTDISAGFFIQAKERFKEYVEIDYRTLDVTLDPVEQGFEEGAFDLIVAANVSVNSQSLFSEAIDLGNIQVLHATPNLSESLRSVRKLLHPRGRLLLQELCPG
jgi:SAM-dependent methyltransferase